MSKNHIRQAIRKAFKKSGLSLRELGERAEVNYQHLGRYISGKPLIEGRPSPDMPTEKASRVMQALGIGVNNEL